MAKRRKAGQISHDRKVAERLEYFKARGFWVRADLPNRAKPPKLGTKIPDIYARKGKELIVEEVETPSTMRTDAKQQDVLREETKSRGGKFSIKIAR